MLIASAYTNIGRLFRVTVPADGITAATVENENFGTSPFFGQLSDKRPLACIWLSGDVGHKAQ